MSLDGFCDAVDQATCGDVPDFTERRDEEDALTTTLYLGLPYPESQLIALAHCLLARGTITDTELSHRLRTVRARLETRSL